MILFVKREMEKYTKYNTVNWLCMYDIIGTNRIYKTQNSSMSAKVSIVERLEKFYIGKI